MILLERNSGMKQRGRPKIPEVQEIIRQCEKLGITYSAYLTRIKKGWTKEEALNTPHVGAVLKTKDGTPIFTYLKSIGKCYGSFINLVHRGCSVEEALDRVENPRGKGKYFREGITLRQWCIKNNKNYVTEYYKVVGRKK